MRWMRAVLLPVLLGLAGVAGADDIPETLRRPPPPPEVRPGTQGFSGFLLLTDDADWAKQWQSGTMPRFHQAEAARIGQPVFVLLFFSNPGLDAAGRAQLRCDFDIARPDGTLALHRPGEVCFQGRLGGDAHRVYLSGPVIGFTADTGDPLGQWTVRASLHDRLRHVSVRLQAPLLLR